MRPEYLRQQREEYLLNEVGGKPGVSGVGRPGTGK